MTKRIREILNPDAWVILEVRRIGSAIKRYYVVYKNYKTVDDFNHSISFNLLDFYVRKNQVEVAHYMENSYCLSHENEIKHVRCDKSLNAIVKQYRKERYKVEIIGLEKLRHMLSDFQVDQ